MATPEVKNIVIIGGGIIGSCTAYFLSHHSFFNPAIHTITILEATRIAGGASGKAGGLLALWAYPDAIVPLSFRLHEELAEKHNGVERWGYRGVFAGQIGAKGRIVSKSSTGGKEQIPAKDEVENPSISHKISLQKRSEDAMALLKAAGVPKDLDWLVPESVTEYEYMGDPNTTAQVHPYQFTTSMVEIAKEKGVNVIIGKAQSIDKSNGEVRTVTYIDKETGQTKTLPADTVVLAAGAWCPNLLPEAPITTIRAHSVTIRPTRPVSAHVLFTQIQLPPSFDKGLDSGKISGRTRASVVTPEIYARPNDEVYACGEGDSIAPLPESTDDVEVVESRCEDIISQVSAISDELRDGEITARQACYLPLGGPLIGRTHIKGLILSSGHTCWGIQNAPGTGKCVSELIWEGKVKSAKIGSLDPMRAM